MATRQKKGGRRISIHFTEPLESRTMLSGDVFIASSERRGGGTFEYIDAGTAVSAFSVTNEAFITPQVCATGSDVFIMNGESSGFGTGPVPNSGYVGEYAFDGSTVNGSLITGLADPSAIAVSGSDLFLAFSSGTVNEYTTSGTLLHAALLSGLSSPTALAISGSDIFVLSSGGTVGKYTLSGATVSAAFLQPPSVGSFSDIAASESDLYALNSEAGTVGAYTETGATLNPALLSGLSSDTAAITVSGSELFTAADTAVGVYTIAGAPIRNFYYNDFGGAPASIAATPTVLPTNPISSLNFGLQPTDLTIGQTSQLQTVSVALEDQDGDLLSTDNPQLEISIASGPTGAVLTGTTQLQAVDGAGLFKDLSFSEPGYYTLKVSDGSHTPAVSTGFTVTTLQTIANLANSAAGDTTGFGDYAMLSAVSDAPTGDLIGKAYEDPNDTRVIVSFADNSTQTSDWQDNAEFAAANPDSRISADVTQALNYINTLRQDYVGSYIFTGYSFAGAIAQLAGSDFDDPAYSFNSPGSEQFASVLLNNAGSISSGNFNYRLYGDQPSLIGTQFATPITLQAPVEDVFPTPTANAAFDLVAAEQQFSDVHSMATILSQINAGVDTVSSDGEPDDSAAIVNALYPGASTTLANGQTQSPVNLSIASANQSLLVSSTGDDVIFTGTAGSADISAITLPDLSTVDDYAVRSQINGNWSAWQNVQPRVALDFTANVDGVEFEPLNAGGTLVAMTTPIFSDVTFANAGSFSGSLTQSQIATTQAFASVTLATSTPVTTIGQTVTFTATVTGTTTPTGTINFDDADGNLLQSVPLQGDGTASLSTTFLQARTDSITALYSGDANYAASVSAPVIQTINAPVASASAVGFARVVLPESAIAGVNFRSSLPVLLTNNGIKQSGTFTFNLYAQSTATDGKQSLLASFRQRISIGAMKKKNLAFHIKALPATLLAGSYNLVTEVIDPANALSLATSSATIEVTAPFVRPDVALSDLSPTTTAPGKLCSILVTVTNTGNIPAKGLVLTITATNSDASAVIYTTTSKRFTIKSQATSKLKLKIRVPKTLAAGTYTLGGLLTLDGIVASTTLRGSLTIS